MEINGLFQHLLCVSYLNINEHTVCCPQGWAADMESATKPLKYSLGIGISIYMKGLKDYEM